MSDEPYFRDEQLGDLSAAANDVLFLYLSRPEWIIRRVEQISILDQQRFRRSNSIDFVVPSGPIEYDSAADFAAVHDDGARTFVLPIASMRKGPLRDFDLKDDDGRSLPLMAKSENSRITASFLSSFAEINDQRQIPPKIIEKITGLDPDNARIAWAEIFGRNHAGFSSDLALEFVDGFLLLARMNARPGDRRILKFQTDSIDVGQLDRPRSSFVELVGNLFSWHEKRIQLEVAGALGCSSYHVEFDSPDDVLIELALLRVPTDEDFSDVDIPGRVLCIERPHGGTGKVHLYTNFSEVMEIESPHTPQLWVMFRMHWSGSLLASTVMLFGTGVALGAGVIMHALGFVRVDDTSASMLVALLGLIALYLGREREHPLITRSNWGPRVLLMICAVIAFIAASVLGVSVRHDGLINADALRQIRVWAWSCGSVLLLLLGCCSLIGLKRSLAVWRQQEWWWRES